MLFFGYHKNIYSLNLTFITFSWTLFFLFSSFTNIFRLSVVEDILDKIDQSNYSTSVSTIQEILAHLSSDGMEAKSIHDELEKLASVKLETLNEKAAKGIVKLKFSGFTYSTPNNNGATSLGGCLLDSNVMKFVMKFSDKQTQSSVAVATARKCETIPSIHPNASFGIKQSDHANAPAEYDGTDQLSDVLPEIFLPTFDVILESIDPNDLDALHKIRVRIHHLAVRNSPGSLMFGEEVCGLLKSFLSCTPHAAKSILAQVTNSLSRYSPLFFPLPDSGKHADLVSKLKDLMKIDDTKDDNEAAAAAAAAAKRKRTKDGGAKASESGGTSEGVSEGVSKGVSEGTVEEEEEDEEGAMAHLYEETEDNTNEENQEADPTGKEETKKKSPRKKKKRLTPEQKNEKAACHRRLCQTHGAVGRDLQAFGFQIKEAMIRAGMDPASGYHIKAKDIKKDKEQIMDVGRVTRGCKTLTFYRDVAYDCFDGAPINYEKLNLTPPTAKQRLGFLALSLFLEDIDILFVQLLFDRSELTLEKLERGKQVLQRWTEWHQFFNPTLSSDVIGMSKMFLSILYSNIFCCTDTFFLFLLLCHVRLLHQSLPAPGIVWCSTLFSTLLE